MTKLSKTFDLSSTPIAHIQVYWETDRDIEVLPDTQWEHVINEDGSCTITSLIDLPEDAHLLIDRLKHPRIPKGAGA